MARADNTQRRGAVACGHPATAAGAAEKLAEGGHGFHAGRGAVSGGGAAETGRGARGGGRFRVGPPGGPGPRG
jgi:gamma-glutamyltranspeptidase/glutathione hydrolase